MKAQELRIGNWILNGINEEFQTNGETINNFDAGQALLGAFKPIPLTEEWLVKFGFVCKLNDPEFLVYVKKIDERLSIRIIITLNEIHIHYCRDWGTSDYSHMFINVIKHVHQLQNLYFALTGEEL